MLEVVRHERMMACHRPVEWTTEHLRPLLQVGGERHEVLGGHETQLASDRFVDEHLRLQRIELPHQAHIEEVHAHASRGIRHLARRAGLRVFDAADRRKVAIVDRPDGIAIFVERLPHALQLGCDRIRIARSGESGRRRKERDGNHAERGKDDEAAFHLTISEVC